MRKSIDNAVKNIIAEFDLKKWIKSLIKDISIEKWKDAFVIYEMFSVGLDSLQRQLPLNEEATFSVPLDKVKKEFINQLNMKEWQFRIVNKYDKVEIAIVIPYEENNREKVISIMDRFGYFNSCDIPFTMGGMPFIAIQFEPMFQDDINNEVRSMNSLYHISPSYNREYIERYGFIPLSRNSEFSYPKRIFFLKGTANNDEIIGLARRLCSLNKDIRNDGSYTVYTILVDSIPTEVKFFQDPNFEDSVFTNDAIPFSTVIEIRKCQIPLKNDS